MKVNRPNVAIIEDEAFLAENLSQMLEVNGYEVSGIAGNFEDGKRIILNENPDVVIIDIDLNASRNGIELGELANELKVKFIYLTSHTESDIIDTAIKTFPFAYLIKPYKTKELLASLTIACQKRDVVEKDDNHKISKEYLFFRHRGILIKIKTKEIVYIKAENVYVVLQTAQKSYLIRSTIHDMLKFLPEESFVRVHRSYIVNIIHIEYIDVNLAKLMDVNVPISRSFKKDLIQKMNMV